MNKFFPTCACLLLLIVFADSVHAQTPALRAEPLPRLSITPYGGTSLLPDVSGTLEAALGSSSFSARSQAGYATGIQADYRIYRNARLEASWTYTRNPIEATTNGRTVSGDYASNIFSFGYTVEGTLRKRIAPLAGLSAAYIQEVDLDMGAGRSFSSDGALGFQLQAGLRYALSPNWSLQVSGQYARFGTLNLVNEQNATERLTDIRYTPFTFGLGITRALTR